jgi:hypothetical protein
MEGCVPDSSRYVPGFRYGQARVTADPPAVASDAIDRTRFPCTGGSCPDELVVLLHGVPGALAAINHDTHPCALEWSGLPALVAEVPRPPPTWPIITIDVGTLLSPVPNERLLVRLMVRLPVAGAVPAGTVIRMGDQAGAAAAVAPVPPPPERATVGADV